MFFSTFIIVFVIVNNIITVSVVARLSANRSHPLSAVITVVGSDY